MAVLPVSKANCPPAQEMLVRLLTVAELLVSPEDESDGQLSPDQRTRQEAVRAALEKSRADQDDV